MQAILARLREPSSLAGLSVLAAMFGADLVQSQAIAQAVAGIAAAAAVFVPESKPAAK